MSREIINSYFDNLKKSLENVLPEKIINYDETNMSDDPGRVKIITKRGCEYPERVMNSSKASTSIMFVCTGTGELLPTYTVYKAIHMYDTLTRGEPPNSRYNRCKSGWFDVQCFKDWLLKIVIPFVKNKPGKKLIIGDNLSTHLTMEGIKACSKYNIEFVFLPPNSTHITQPLDVAFFRPMKFAWREILTKWKMGKGSRECSIPKDQFPKLLNKLMKRIEGNQVDNIKAGFKKCGIIPLDRQPVLNMLPPESNENGSLDSEAEVVNDSLVSILKSMRYPCTEKKALKKRQRMKIEPGQSVEVDNQKDSNDSEISVNEDDNINKSDDGNSPEDRIIIGSDWNGSDEDANLCDLPLT